jgi:hypothetical protein
VLTIHAALGWLPAETALQPLDLMPAAARHQLAGPATRLLEAVGDGEGAGRTASLVRVRALRGDS